MAKNSAFAGRFNRMLQVRAAEHGMAPASIKTPHVSLRRQLHSWHGMAWHGMAWHGRGLAAPCTQCDLCAQRCACRRCYILQSLLRLRWIMVARPALPSILYNTLLLSPLSSSSSLRISSPLPLSWSSNSCPPLSPHSPPLLFLLPP